MLTIARRFEQVLEAASAACLLALMLIVLVDVVGRDLFNRPLSAATEVLEIVVAAMVFLVYPILGFREKHITVDLLQVGPVGQRLQRFIGALFGVVAFALIAWCVGRQVLRAMDYGEASPILGIPLVDVLAGMSALAAVTAVGFAAAAVRRALWPVTQPHAAEGTRS
ncbi:MULTISPECIES: TRAP transporter small permease [unclassified Bradyrhizobium]